MTRLVISNKLKMTQGKEILNKLEKGLKNKHYSAKEIQDLIMKYEEYTITLMLIQKHIRDIEIKAGYFDKNKNIFLEGDNGGKIK